jgi:hypothetical protein
MIDTLQLILHDYDASGADLELQHGTTNTKTGEITGSFQLYKSGGRMVEGRKAFNNEGPCRVTIKAIPSRDERGMQPLCTVAMEVPRVASSSNYHPTDEKGTARALGIVQRHLDSIGLKANVMEAQPARLDAFRNVIAAEPYSCYAPVLQLINGSRMEKRGYENGFLWENGVQQVCAYDKLQKMVRDKLSVDGLPANTIRFEMRLLKSKKVRDTLEVRTARELLEKYEGLVDAYKKTMEKQIFRHNVDDVDALFHSDIKQSMGYFKGIGGRNWLQQWMMAFAYQALMQQTNIETVLAVVGELEEDKEKCSRLKKKLETTQFETEALLTCGPSKRTTGQLYEEMREKVLGSSVR